jgi:predicted aminopeptidase
MRRVLKFLGRALLAALLLLAIWTVWNRKLISYGWMQFKGQWHIISQARPIDEVLADSSVSDSIKTRLNFIHEIRVFAIDSLGLKDTKNYTSFYDQHGKPLLWVLTASEAFRLKAYTWSFPIVGKVSYKGFFKKDKGLQEAFKMRLSGYDTDFGEVSAWSTLGWFHDPILSSMLSRSDGKLAELIIHEMTHSTLYVKSNVDFNENLASAIGEAGAEKFLRHYYGPDSPQLNYYLLRREDVDMFSNYMLESAKKLDSLYQRIENFDDGIKMDMKQAMMTQIVSGLDSLPFHFPEKYKNIFADQLPNNAYFLNFIRYDAQKAEMTADFRDKFGGNIPAYLKAIAEKYN